MCASFRVLKLEHLALCFQASAAHAPDSELTKKEEPDDAEQGTVVDVKVEEAEFVAHRPFATRGSSSGRLPTEPNFVQF